ncbi:MAG: hypothetical protein LKJ25_00475 [Clostridia bacterium]|nr:hypothetical protein [Clostridia bacterium]
MRDAKCIKKYAKGLKCPLSVIKAKEAMEEMKDVKDAEVLIEVDNEIAVPQKISCTEEI